MPYLLNGNISFGFSNNFCPRCSLDENEKNRNQFSLKILAPNR
jgi:hypothetical protein